MPPTVLKDDCWFRFWVFFIFRFVFCVFFCNFVLVALGSVSSVLCQQLGWQERLWNDVFCVECNVKPWLSQWVVTECSSVDEYRCKQCHVTGYLQHIQFIQTDALKACVLQWNMVICLHFSSSEVKHACIYMYLFIYLYLFFFIYLFIAGYFLNPC